MGQYKEVKLRVWPTVSATGHCGVAIGTMVRLLHAIAPVTKFNCCFGKSARLTTRTQSLNASLSSVHCMTSVGIAIGTRPSEMHLRAISWSQDAHRVPGDNRSVIAAAKLLIRSRRIPKRPGISASGSRHRIHQIRRFASNPRKRSRSLTRRFGLLLGQRAKVRSESKTERPFQKSLVWIAKTTPVRNADQTL